jgi:hypothetical protein
MITSFAQLLRELQIVEDAELRKQNITHAPTIGAMYEGLTKDLLDRAIPAELGLRLVNGFVSDHEGNLSRQIDCMLVYGEGEAIPYVPGTYKWPVQKALAVFEVKKTLYGDELEDSYDKLRGIVQSYMSVMDTGGADGIDITPAHRAFADLTGIYPATMAEANALPDGLDQIFHILVFEWLSPLRVIFGYGGYADEYALRDGFCSYL